MQSRRRYSATLQAYQEQFGQHIPSTVARCAPVVGRTQQLQDDLEHAMQTGEPIQRWTRYTISRFDELVQEYQDRLGQKAPPQALEQAADVGLSKMLVDAIQEAINTGEPIHDWDRFARGSPEPSEAAG